MKRESSLKTFRAGARCFQGVLFMISVREVIGLNLKIVLFCYFCRPIIKTNERLLQLFNSAVDIWFYDVYKFVFPQPPFIGAALFEINIIQ